MANLLNRAIRAYLDNPTAGARHLVEIALASAPQYVYPDRDFLAGLNYNGLTIMAETPRMIVRVRDALAAAELLPHYQTLLREAGLPEPANIQYALEIYDAVSDSWIRQLDRHESLESVQSSAHDIQHWVRRDCRIVKIVTHEETLPCSTS